MSTYSYEKVMADYANGKITPEMAIGHSLQHIGKLYEALAAVSRTADQTKIDALERRVNTLQAMVDRLTVTIEKLRTKRQSGSPTSSKPAQA